MNRGWDGICKVGIVQFMIFPEVMRGEGPVVETITKIAADDFFGAMEITHIADPEARRQVAGILAASHMALGFGAQPMLLANKLDLNHPEEAERRKAVDLMKAAIDEAAELGIGRVAFLSGKDPGEAQRERALNLLVDSTKELCEYAKSRGVFLICETFDYDVEKRALIGPARLAARYAERVKAQYDNFGLMYDLSHVPQLREDALEGLSILKPHLAHVHVGNCQLRNPNHPSYGDQHPRFGIPDGENDVPELTAFLKALFQVGYLQEHPKGDLPVVAFEVKPMKGELSEVVLANTKRVWREAWGRLEL
jgi:sugar phosphate isomerase/epimerase